MSDVKKGLDGVLQRLLADVDDAMVFSRHYSGQAKVLAAVTKAKERIEALIEQKQTEARIDELQRMSVHKPVLDREERLKFLKEQQGKGE